jgi:leucyl-tRNA synthetase
MVIAPEHPLTEQLTTAKQKQQVNTYVKAAQAKSDVERQETSREKTGVFTGSYAINPVNGEKIPIWIADYVLMGYGTGAIMAVPAHDQRDHEFAKKFDLPIINVVDPVAIREDAKDKDKFVEKKKIVAVVQNKDGELLSINWGPKLGGRLFIGGTVEGNEAPEVTAIREVAEETGYTDLEVAAVGQETFHYKYYAFSKQEAHSVEAKFVLLKLKSDKQQAQNLDESEKGNFTVEWISPDQATQDVVEPLHRYAFEKFILGECFHGEGVMTNSGDYDGLPSDEAREKIVTDLAAKGMGKERVNYKIRDWLISRQRYWGAPIPIVHCEKDGAVAVPDDQLPVVLPELKNFQPTGEGTSVLASVKDWVNTTCPKCGGPATRETDTMDGFACSSWYFLRFADPHNDKEPFDKDKAKFWLPVDDYIGGAEHAVMHLLYARMWTKVMHDAGLIEFDEPFTALRNHRKMSKSWGNVIAPDELIDQGYGADSIRIMELFIGPWDQQANWSVEGMGGCFRFLQRVWTLVQEHLEACKKGVTEAEASKDLNVALHKAIKRVSDDLHQMGFNTAIAAQMELINELYKLKTTVPLGTKQWQNVLSTFLQLLAPFAPHMSEELWHELGNKGSIHVSEWPLWDEKLLVSDTVTVVVQVNGKVRARLEVATGADEATVTEAAKANERVKAYLDGQTVKKVIFVPGKLISFVI